MTPDATSSCSVSSQRYELRSNFANITSVTFMRPSPTRVHDRKIPKNLRYPRRAPLPPEPEADRFFRHTFDDAGPTKSEVSSGDALDPGDPILAHHVDGSDGDGEVIWDEDEIETISSLFRGRIPQKPGKLVRERPLPLPTPHKLRPSRLPTPKRNFRPPTSPASSSKHLYKNPEFLTGIARDIRSLPPEKDVSLVLNKCAPFLRKGSLSLTIRELGHMGLPDRALQTFCWAQKQPLLFPDDRTLASTVEVLARFHELKVPFDLDNFKDLASQTVMEAMVRGFMKGGSLKLAWKLISVARNSNRMLDSSIYAKMILQLSKDPDHNFLVLTLLDELAEREDLSLSSEDCTAVMKVCRILKKYELVESLFNWHKQTGRDTTIVMYTMVIHSRICEGKLREAMELVWEMEAANYLLDFPAYRVVIKLLVSLNDIPRANRYFKRLKDAGFAPTYDIYCDLMKLYLGSGRLAKCRELKKELDTAGFALEAELKAQWVQLVSQTKLGS
uniref:Pentatricopeptide repeat-containing protein n=1 Tax=Kalanchoe fedtschenkoi TaxID=63787 RepID=A0A7N1A058_KALFE